MRDVVATFMSTYAGQAWLVWVLGSEAVSDGRCGVNNTIGSARLSHKELYVAEIRTWHS